MHATCVIEQAKLLCKANGIVIQQIRTQGRSQRSATDAKAPARLIGAPATTFFTHQCGIAVRHFLGKLTRPPAANGVLSKFRGPQ